MIEIERKFLVQPDSNWAEHVDNTSQISQGYVSTQSTTVRVRVKDRQAFLTIKGPTDGISRLEFEYEIPVADAQKILEALCHGNAIHKLRHEVTVGGHLWTIDEFLADHKGLLLAEVELSSEEEAFEVPSWVLREVSDDARYFNSNLVGSPTPPTV